MSRIGVQPGLHGLLQGDPADLPGLLHGHARRPVLLSGLAPVSRGGIIPAQQPPDPRAGKRSKMLAG